MHYCGFLIYHYEKYKNMDAIILAYFFAFVNRKYENISYFNHKEKIRKIFELACLNKDYDV